MQRRKRGSGHCYVRGRHRKLSDTLDFKETTQTSPQSQKRGSNIQQGGEAASQMEMNFILQVVVKSSGCSKN